MFLDEGGWKMIRSISQTTLEVLFCTESNYSIGADVCNELDLDH